MISDVSGARRRSAFLVGSGASVPRDQAQHASVSSSIQTSSTSLFDRILASAKHGLFGVLYVMSKNTHHTESWMLATFIIEFFHLLAFTFSEEAAFPWDPKVASILRVARYARFDLINFFGPHNQLIWFIFATAIVIGILLTTIHVSLAFTRNKIGSILPLRILREFAGTLVSFLFVPFLSTFAQTSHCRSISFQSLGIACDSAAQYAVATLSITLAIVMFCFAALFGACFYNCDPSRHDANSRPHARFEVVYHCVVATIAVGFNIVEISNPDTHLGLAILFIIGSVILTGSVIFFLPYYSTKFVYIRAALCAIWCWCNFCLVIVVIAHEPASNSFSSLLFLGMPLCGLLAILATKARISSLQESPPSKLRSAFEVEIKARFYLLQHDLLYRTKVDVNDEGSETQRQQHLNYVKDQLYLFSMHRFPTSSILRIFAAHFFAFHMENQQMAAVLFESAIKRYPRLDELFRIHRHRMLSIERRDVNDGNVLAGIDYEQTSLQALAAIRATLLAQKAFWSVLLEPEPDLSRLQAFGSHISRHVNTADQKCRHLMALDPDAPEALRMYGLFLQHALNDPEGEMLQQRANQIEEQGRKLGTSSPFNMKYIPVFKIGLNTGLIHQVNRAACKMVGKTAVQLEGFSINSILPKVIAENHDHLMRKFAQEGHAQSIITLERELFFQHCNGHIVIVQATLRNCPEAGAEPSILASVCSDPVLNDPNHHHLIIELPTTKIHNYSEHALDWLRIPKLARLTQPLFVCQYVKEITCNNLQEFMGDHDGLLRTIRLDEGRSGSIQVQIHIRPLLTPPYAMLRFRIIRAPIATAFESEQQTNQIQIAFQRQPRIARAASASCPVKTVSISKAPENERSAPLHRDEMMPSLTESNTSHTEEDCSQTERSERNALNENQSMIMAIRHKLMRQASQLDRGVILLGLALLISLLGILILTISNRIFVSEQATVNLQNLHLIQDSAYQQHDLSFIMFRLQALHFKAINQPNAIGPNMTLVAGTFHNIGRFRYRLSELHLSRTSLDDPIIRALHKTSVSINSSALLSSTFTYGDALYSVLDSALSALNRIISFDDRVKRDLFVIDRHGPISARAILAEISDLLIRAARDQISYYLYWKYVYLVVSLVLIVLLLLFAFVPTIAHFERENNTIASIFLAIPRHAVEGLRQETIRSLQIWKQSSDDQALFHADLNDTTDIAEPSTVAEESEEESQIKVGSVEILPTQNEAGQFDATVDDGPFRTELESSEADRYNAAMKMQQHRPQMRLSLSSMRKAQTLLGRAKASLVSRRRYLSLLVQICLLLIIWAVYTGVTYAQDQTELLRHEAMASEVFISAMIPAQFQSFLYFSARATASQTHSETLDWIGRASASLRSVESMLQGVLYRGTVNMKESDPVFPDVTYQLDGAVMRYSERDALMFQDACAQLSDVDVQGRCYKFAINTTTPYLFSTGLSNSLSSMIGLSYNVRDQLATMSLDDLLSNPHVIAIDTMMSDVMGSLLQLNSDLFLKETRALQQAYGDKRRLLLAMFFVLLIGSAFFLYWPMMKRLDLSNKCTRGMILLVPAKILNSVPEIRMKLRII